ncbi:MAG: hypothetical protein KDA44_13395 [Planctomycetales bacterium]|nr:hypothetical protein [Planctomycetales bacterium]
MYCSNCGARAGGNFCSSCGTRLAGRNEAAEEPETDRVETPDGDWTTCCDYQRLIAHPEVRRRLNAAAGASPQRLSGEQFLSICDGLLGGVTGGIALSAIAKFALPLNKKLGLKTGKQRALQAPLPVGVAVVETLCWLARSGRSLRSAEQLPAGCRLLAALPSDLRSFEGELRITISSASVGSSVLAEANIPGQLYDWGKSAACLDELAAALGRSAAA